MSIKLFKVSSFKKLVCSIALSSMLANQVLVSMSLIASMPFIPRVAFADQFNDAVNRAKALGQSQGDSMRDDPKVQYDQSGNFQFKSVTTDKDTGAQTTTFSTMNSNELIPQGGSSTQDQSDIENTTGDVNASNARVNAIGGRLSSEQSTQGRAYQTLKNGPVTGASPVDNLRTDPMWSLTKDSQRTGARNILDSCTETTTTVDLSTEVHLKDERICTWAYEENGSCEIKREISTGGTFTSPLFRTYGTTDHNFQVSVEFLNAFGSATCYGNAAELRSCAAKAGIDYTESFEGGGAGFFGDQPQGMDFYDPPTMQSGDGYALVGVQISGGGSGCDGGSGSAPTLSSARLNFTCGAPGFQSFDYTVTGIFQIIRNNFVESRPGCLAEANTTDAFCRGDAVDKEFIFARTGSNQIKVSSHVDTVTFDLVGGGGGGGGGAPTQNSNQCDESGNCGVGEPAGGGGGGGGGYRSATVTLDTKESGVLTVQVGNAGSQGGSGSSGGNGGTTLIKDQSGDILGSASGGIGGAGGQTRITTFKCDRGFGALQDGPCDPDSGGTNIPNTTGGPGSGGAGGTPSGRSGSTGTTNNGGAGGSSKPSISYAPGASGPGRNGGSGAAGGGGAGGGANTSSGWAGGFGGTGYAKVSFTDYIASNVICTEEADLTVAGTSYTIPYAKLSKMKELYASEYETRGNGKLCKKAVVTPQCQSNYGIGNLECYEDANGNQQCPQSDGSQDPNAQCLALQNQGCTFVEEKCADNATSDNPDFNGRCYVSTRIYDCGGNVTVPNSTQQRQSSCGAVRCAGTDCVDDPDELNTDFGKVAATLQALDEIKNDMTCENNNPSSCEVFKGMSYNCKKAFSGIQDCCDQPAGTTLTDYLRLMFATKTMNEHTGIVSQLGNAVGYDTALTTVNGAWDQITNATSSAASDILQPITEPIMTAVDSVQSVIFGGSGGAAGNAATVTDGLTSFVSPGEIISSLSQKAGEWVVQNFGEQAGSALFANTGTAAAPNYVFAGAGSILGYVMAAYAIYSAVVLLIQILFPCEDSEFELAVKRETKTCTHVGGFCAGESLGYCFDKRDSFCCFNSPLSRILQEQIRPQLGIGFGTGESPECRGLTLAEIANADFNQVDLSEWTAMLTAAGIKPQTVEAQQEALSAGNIDRFSHTRSLSGSAQDRIEATTGGSTNIYNARENIRNLPPPN